MFNIKKTTLTAFYCALAFILLVSIYKDVSFTQPMPTDLRNRIVGARMMKDGLSPYFYNWRVGAPVRYYDNCTFPNFMVSGVTSSPFFNHVFGLIADLPQFQLNAIWLLLQYFALIACCGLAISSQSRKDRKKTLPLIAAIAVAFTFTIGWKAHVFSGQNYIFIPLLAMACFNYMMRVKKPLNILLFAVFAVSLVLMRPTALIIFLPFVFFLNLYWKWAVTSLLFFAAYVVFVLSNPIQKLNWNDYFKALTMHVNIHQGVYEGKPDSAYRHPRLINFEGINDEKIVNQKGVEKFWKKIECRNLYIIYNGFTGKRLSVKTMTIISIITVSILLIPLFWFNRKNIAISPAMLFGLGFVLYEVISFCSPIMRPNYCGVEFLFPLLLVTIYMKKTYIIPVCFLIIGFCLNIIAPSFVPLRQNFGEALIIFAVLCQAYRPIMLLLFKEKKWNENNNVYWI